MRTRYTAYQWKLGCSSWDPWSSDDTRSGEDIPYLNADQQDVLSAMTREFMEAIRERFGFSIHGEWGPRESVWTIHDEEGGFGTWQV